MKRSQTKSNTSLIRLLACILFLPCFLLMEKSIPAMLYYLAGFFLIYAIVLYACPRTVDYLNLVFPFSLVIDLLFITAFLYFLDRYIHVLATFYLLPIIIASFHHKAGAPYGAAILAATCYLLLAITQGYWLVPIIIHIISFFVVAICMSIMTQQFHYTYSLQANQDSLTKVSNRRYFNIYMKKLISSKTPHSFILIDIDNFKQLNDTQGHHHGDYVLKIVAATLKEYSKESDMVARYGGDEFALILPDTSKEESQKIAEKIRNSILINPKLLPYPHISVSLGIAAYPDDANDLEELLEKVDLALYAAKDRGKNNVYVYRRE